MLVASDDVDSGEWWIPKDFGTGPNGRLTKTRLCCTQAGSLTGEICVMQFLVVIDIY
jgi:hypothetical protein